MMTRGRKNIPVRKINIKIEPTLNNENDPTPRSPLRKIPTRSSSRKNEALKEKSSVADENFPPTKNLVLANPSLLVSDKTNEFILQALAKSEFLEELSMVIGFGMNRTAQSEENNWQWSLSLRGFPTELFKSSTSVVVNTDFTFSTTSENINFVYNCYFDKLLNLLPSIMIHYRPHFLNCFNRLNCTKIDRPPEVPCCLVELKTFFEGIRRQIEIAMVAGLSICWTMNADNEGELSLNVRKSLQLCGNLHWEKKVRDFSESFQNILTNIDKCPHH